MPGSDDPLFEVVVNVSEGRDDGVITAMAGASGPALLDTHSDPDHNRSVFTLAGRSDQVGPALERLIRAAVAKIDMATHRGVHPRIGAVDVVPWVALSREADGTLVDGSMEDALTERNRFAGWAASELGLPCFLYGPERSLPDVRREAWKGLLPEFGPHLPHPTAGSIAVGARPVLVAYNLWLADPDLELARDIAASIRSPVVRTLGLAVGESVQVSCNLIAPWSVGPGAAFDSVASRSAVARAELVGLVPEAVLRAEPPHRWDELGLDPSRTIEARL